MICHWTTLTTDSFSHHKSTKWFLWKANSWNGFDYRPRSRLICWQQLGTHLTKVTTRFNCLHTSQYSSVLLCSLVSETTKQVFEMTKKSKISAIDFVAIENSKSSQIIQYIKNQIAEWKQYDFTDDNLWKMFLKNFDDYTEIDFFLDNKNVVRQLRICFRSRGVWMKIESKILFHRTLINTLKKKIN